MDVGQMAARGSGGWAGAGTARAVAAVAVTVALVCGAPRAAAYSNVSVGTTYTDSLVQGNCWFYRFIAYGSSGFTVSLVANSGDPELCLSVATPPATMSSNGEWGAQALLEICSKSLMIF